jgi:serine/threonine protein kinase
MLASPEEGARVKLIDFGFCKVLCEKEIKSNLSGNEGYCTILLILLVKGML